MSKPLLFTALMFKIILSLWVDACVISMGAKVRSEYQTSKMEIPRNLFVTAVSEGRVRMEATGWSENVRWGSKSSICTLCRSWHEEWNGGKIYSNLDRDGNDEVKGEVVGVGD